MIHTRDRAWRRYIEEIKVIHRINNIVKSYNWYGFYDVNGFYVARPILKDHIGSSKHYMFKTHTTKTYDSKSKDKYSSNKSRTHWRTNGTPETREGQKIIFFKILKENGIK